MEQLYYWLYLFIPVFYFMAHYWTKKHEEACEAFRIATTPKEELLAYNVFIFGLTTICNNIQQKYYYTTTNLRDEAINNCILAIKTKYNVNKSSTYFSFCSVVIKNYYYEQVMRVSKIRDVDSIDDYPELINEFPDNTISIEEKDDDNQKRILKRFKQLLARDEDLLAVKQRFFNTTGKTTTEKSMRLVVKHIAFMKACIEYVQRFPNGSMQGMVEYCQSVTGFTDNVVKVCGIHYFNYSHMPRNAEVKEKNAFKNGMKQNKYNDSMQAFTHDNWCPNDSEEKKFRSRRNAGIKLIMTTRKKK